MAAERRASVTWNGDLMSGSGTIDEVGSGAFGPLDVSWAARSEEASGGKTSPEELIAAAHASCFSMALSLGLAKAGTPPDRLQTSAVVTFVPGTGITKSALTVRGTVPGLDADGFREAAEAAKRAARRRRSPAFQSHARRRTRRVAAPAHGQSSVRSQSPARTGFTAYSQVARSALRRAPARARSGRPRGGRCGCTSR
jgi:osmotically inducible protein OsmC